MHIDVVLKPFCCVHRLWWVPSFVVVVCPPFVVMVVDIKKLYYWCIIKSLLVPKKQMHPKLMIQFDLMLFTRMNGVQLEFNKAEVGSTTQSIDRSHTSCSSGGPSTSSSNRTTRLNKLFLLSENICYCPHLLVLSKTHFSFPLEMNICRMVILVVWVWAVISMDVLVIFLIVILSSLNYGEFRLKSILLCMTIDVSLLMWGNVLGKYVGLISCVWLFWCHLVLSVFLEIMKG